MSGDRQRATKTGGRTSQGSPAAGRGVSSYRVRSLSRGVSLVGQDRVDRHGGLVEAVPGDQS